MIVLTVMVWGIAFVTWHIDLGINLPVKSWRASYAFLSIEVSSGPLALPAPSSSVLMAPSSMPAVHPSITHQSLGALTSPASLSAVGVERQSAGVGVLPDEVVVA